MDPLFYHHIIPLEETLKFLDNYQLSPTEKVELEDMILSMFHHRILDIILLSIPPEHHDQLIERIALNPHDQEIMILIKSLNPDVEDHIQSGGKVLAEEVRALLWKV